MTDGSDWDDVEAAEKAAWNIGETVAEAVAAERQRCTGIAEEAMNLCRAIEPGEHADGQRCMVCEKLRTIGEQR